ncbi:glyoxalase [Nakamurella sp. YIM 132087]|uniref:Glyoxalase n=1 Tax=Nakamurella alba TaxID=2665158 RepID=A0A7K1FGV4_9ACTN|nr:VOC family protein [Nakamurella alba]MTD13300.1 glyoxalase [Nakamurella alba]
MTDTEHLTGTERIGTWPALIYADAEAALTYLVEVVGFTESMVVRGDGDRPIMHAELRWPGGGGVMFGSTERGNDWTGRSRVGDSSLYLVIDDPAVVAERVLAAGWQVVRPLQETDYGSKEFGFLDPEGNAFSIGTYAGAHATG